MSPEVTLRCSRGNSEIKPPTFRLQPHCTLPPEPQRPHEQKKGHFAQIQSSKVKDIKKIRKTHFFLEIKLKLCRKFFIFFFFYVFIRFFLFQLRACNPALIFVLR